jgi:hypothetical protein
VVRTTPGRDERARRRSERVGAVGLLAAVALPVLLWRDVVADIAVATAGERLSVVVVGWAPWVLMTLGILCVIPIAVERHRSRGGRFYSTGTGAWQGWGVTLYLLGFALATQVAQIHGIST